jgi:hypothetical protein
LGDSPLALHVELIVLQVDAEGSIRIGGVLVSTGEGVQLYGTRVKGSLLRRWVLSGYRVDRKERDEQKSKQPICRAIH